MTKKDTINFVETPATEEHEVGLFRRTLEKIVTLRKAIIAGFNNVNPDDVTRVQKQIMYDGFHY